MKRAACALHLRCSCWLGQLSCLIKAEPALARRMGQIAKILIGFGIALVVAGGLMLLVQRLGIARLPGDLAWKGKHGTFYFPIATSVLLSLILTLLLNVWLGRQR